MDRLIIERVNTGKFIRLRKTNLPAGFPFLPAVHSIFTLLRGANAE